MNTEEYIKIHEENKKFERRVNHVARLIGALPEPEADGCPISFDWILGGVIVMNDGWVEAMYDPDDNAAYENGYGCPIIKFPKAFLDDSMTDDEIVDKAKELGIYQEEYED